MRVTLASEVRMAARTSPAAYPFSRSWIVKAAAPGSSPDAIDDPSAATAAENVGKSSASSSQRP